MTGQLEPPACADWPRVKEGQSRHHFSTATSDLHVPRRGIGTENVDKIPRIRTEIVSYLQRRPASWPEVFEWHAPVVHASNSHRRCDAWTGYDEQDAPPKQKASRSPYRTSVKCLAN